MTHTVDSYGVEESRNDARVARFGRDGVGPRHVATTVPSRGEVRVGSPLRGRHGVTHTVDSYGVEESQNDARVARLGTGRD